MTSSWSLFIQLIKWNLSKRDGAWIVFVWFRTGTKQKFQFHKMWGNSEAAQELLTSEEDLSYLVLVGWMFRIRAGFEWLKTGHVSCCSETGNNASQNGDIN